MLKTFPVPDSRKALAQVSAIFLANPSLHLKVVGITGTNGKTTTSYLLESIFRQAGYIPGVMGTIHYRFGNKIVQSSNTTP
ncbi:MAG: UDP-N-acetylmuramoyl-L-alanyl-D-glutamate--2,6-diaminopimelate ligase, partial [Deltaproteobacteria bacterium]|nr:UDP-N-acetylmuramoyl-L-alanyl-D-glutamate--2,6-diaminopimelate ligase [Deltaproteobacteria bacterium]